MDTERSELEATAAEYVLGTLRGAERDIFEARMHESADLQRMVAQWQDMLIPMAALARKVEPPPALWQRIERSIAPTAGAGATRPAGPGADAPPRAQARPAPPTPQPAAPAGAGRNAADTNTAGEDDAARGEIVVLRRRLNRWRFGAITAVAAAVALAAYVGTVAPPIGSSPTLNLTAVLTPVDVSPVWSIRYDARDHRLQADAITPGASPPGQSYELWALPADGQPVSLGLLPSGRQTTLTVPQEVARNLGGGIALAVSVEPPGGSPTGQPTGEVVHTGRMELAEPSR